MGEVEKKFALTLEVKRKLVEEAEFLGSRDYTDTYFDTAQYDWTTQDIWLRSRGPIFQLKIPLHASPTDVRKLANYYDQIDTETEIREKLQIPVDGRFFEDLEDAGYIPFATFTTTRAKYRKEGFIVDDDFVDFDYRLAKIRLEIIDEEEKESSEEAAKKILTFATRFGLREVPLRAKVIEYIRRTDPEHYNALAEAGLVDKKEGLLGGFGNLAKP